MLEVWAREYMKALTPQHHYFRFVTIALLIAVAAFLTFAYTSRVVRAESAEVSGEHIITVHDDGVDKGFITQKSTLREALAEAKITIDPKDRTEPGLDDKLVARSYQVNVYRARAVLVRDGTIETKVITSYRTGKQIAKDAGITLQDEDKATLASATDLARTGAPEILTITRAIPVSFVFYGKPVQLYTFAKTIGQLLAEKRITPAANDTLSPAAATPITRGMHIELWKNGEQTVTVDEDIAFETQQVKDADHDKTYKEVKTPGATGKKTVTYKIVMQNGKEVKREVINSVTTKEPVTQVEVIGIKVNLPPGSHTDWMAAAGISASDYGYVEWLIQKESGWNPGAVNRTSGACGLVQALPCSKLGENWDDPIVALRWGNSYVEKRYGGWSGAYEFWQTNRWY